MHKAPDMGRLTVHNTRLAVNARTGIWEIHWTGRDSRGQSHGYSAGAFTTDEDEAKAYRVQWLKARNEVVAALTTPTVAEIIERYVRWCEAKHRHVSQIAILRRVSGFLGAYPPQDLEGDTIDDFVYQRGRDGVCDTSVRRELGALLAALNWAAHPGKGRMIKRSDVPQILLPEAVYEERGYLKEAEEAEFLGRALAWRYKPIGIYVAIGLNTGARKEAIERLTWPQIDMTARVIDFRQHGDRIHVKRKVPTAINDRLFVVLDAVPVSERWGRVLPNAMHKGFTTFVKSTPYEWVTSHIMRHTFITLGLRAGVTIEEMSGLVGDTTGIIRKHYWHHAADAEMHAAANKRFRK